MQNRIQGNSREKKQKHPIQSAFENPLYTVMYKNMRVKYMHINESLVTEV